MTESEARKEIIESGIKLGAGDYVDIEALEVAVQALEAYEAYQEIGTIEEFKAIKQWNEDIIESFSKYDVNSVDELMQRFKELTEKAEPKKVIGIEAKLLGRYCPICCEVFSELEIKKRIKWCPKCNQSLDWE